MLSTVCGGTQTRIRVRISNTATLARTEVSKFQGDCASGQACDLTSFCNGNRNSKPPHLKILK